MAWFRPRRSLTKARVLLTGASSGIGHALAQELAKHQAELVLVARNEERLEQVAAEIRSLGGKAIPLAGDVTDASVRAKAIALCETELGGLDLLINNAGVGAYGRYAEVGPDRLRTLMEVNFFAAAELMREAISLLERSSQPVVVNLGSILGERGIPQCSEYCASKFALHGLSESVRPEYRQRGIDLLVVAPGTTATKFKENVVDQQTTPPWTRRGGVSAEYVAQQTVRALQRRATFIIPNRVGWLMTLANRIVPRLVDRVMNRYG